jgi:hypothetical protein
MCCKHTALGRVVGKSERPNRRDFLSHATPVLPSDGLTPLGGLEVDVEARLIRLGEGETKIGRQVLKFDGGESRIRIE